MFEARQLQLTQPKVPIPLTSSFVHLIASPTYGLLHSTPFPFSADLAIASFHDCPCDCTFRVNSRILRRRSISILQSRAVCRSLTVDAAALCFPLSRRANPSREPPHSFNSLVLGEAKGDGLDTSLTNFLQS